MTESTPGAARVRGGEVGAASLDAWSDRAVFGGLVALIVAATMSGLTRDVTVWGREITIRPDQVVLLALLPAIAAALLRRGRRPRRAALHLPALALLAVNALASVAVSTVRDASLQGTVLMGIYVTMYAGVVVLIADRPGWARRLLAVVVGLGFVHAIYGIASLVLYAQGIDVGGLMIGQVGRRSITPRSTLPEANLLGAFMLVVAVFSAMRLVSVRSRARRAAWLAGFSLAGLTLVLTMTRAAWLCFVLGLVLIGLVLWRRGGSLRGALAAMRPVLLGLVVIAALSLLAFDPLLSRLWGQEHVVLTRVASLSFLARPPASCRADAWASKDAAALGSCTSVAGRVGLIEKGLLGWRARPLLGHGTFGGKAIGRSYWMGSGLQALYDTGALGAAALLAMYAVAVAAPWWASSRAVSAGDRDVLLACAIGNALLMLTSQFASFLWVGFPWVFMGLSAAAVTAVGAPARRAGGAAVASAAERC